MPADSESRTTRDSQTADPMAEHKRRARWRLLGAIIITGAVAAVAPVLLEDQARPLSQDLLIEIPSKNSSFGKIESLKPAASTAQAPAPAPIDNPPETKAEVKAKAEVKSQPKAEPKVEPKPEPKAEAKSKADVKAKSEPKPETKPETKAEPKPVAPKAGYLVQVGAYASLESANGVRTKLISGGHSVQLQTVTLDDGSQRHRVRIGPFETRDQAIAIRDRAKSQGYDAVVVGP